MSACQQAAAPPLTQAPAAAPTQAGAAKPAATTAAAPTTAPAAKPAPTAAAPAPAANAPAVALHVSYSNLIADNLPEWLALETGIFKQNALDVTLDNIASSTGIPALLSGQVQIAHLGGSESLSAAAEGGDLVIIAITGPVYPFVFMAPAAITSVDHIKGMKIGVSNVASMPNVELPTIRVSASRPGADPAIIAATVAAPLERQLGTIAGVTEITSVSSLGQTSIVVQRSWLNANHDVAQRYIDSIVQAIARSKKNKEESIPVLQKYLKNDDQRALGVTYDFFVGTVTPNYPVVNASLFADAIEQLSATNDKIKTFDVNKILDNQYVQSAMDRKVGGP